MARWEPDATGRLTQAAMELFQERGYDRVTVGEIAARAGLTERTFFRYFADKREVLFSGSEELVRAMKQGIVESPDGEPPMVAIGRVLASVGRILESLRTRDEARARFAVVTSHSELMERERMKMSKLAVALGEALRERGVAEPAASLAAEAGIAVFRVGFEQWLADPAPDASLADHLRRGLETLQRVTAPVAKPARKKR